MSQRLNSTRQAMAEVAHQQQEMKESLAALRIRDEKPEPEPEIREVIRHVVSPPATADRHVEAFWDRIHLSQPELRIFK